MKTLTKLLLIIGAFSTLALSACGGKDKSSSSGIDDYYRYDRDYNGRYSSGNMLDVGTGYNSYSDSDLTLAIAANGTLRGDMFLGYDGAICNLPYGRYDIRSIQSGGFYSPPMRTLQGATVEARMGGRIVRMYIQSAIFYDYDQMAANISVLSVNGFPCGGSIFFGQW